MKDKRKYFFIGARFFTLEKMLNLGLDLACIAVVKNSPVHNECKKRKLKYKIISKKKQLLDLIRKTDFDVLVSNGCPYILPISDLKKDKEIYINIHPSLLPDLKGFSPVNGAILFNRPQGATCHIMDDGIDTGSIISQVKVTDVPNISLDALYQLTFMAEAMVFEKAYKRDFKVSNEVLNVEKPIYYTRKIEDQIITKKDNINEIITKVKAFKVEGQYARLFHDDVEFQVKDIEIINTDMFNKEKHKNNEIIHIYKNNVITKEKDCLLLWRLNSADNLVIGDILIK